MATVIRAKISENDINTNMKIKEEIYMKTILLAKEANLDFSDFFVHDGKAGMFWWKWDQQIVRPDFLDDPAGDKGFTIYGKPAAEVMHEWCRKKNNLTTTKTQHKENTLCPH